MSEKLGGYDGKVYKFICELDVASLVQIAEEFNITVDEARAIVEPFIGSLMEWGSHNYLGDLCVQMYD